MNAVKVWCGRHDWHGLHAWQEVDADDEPITDWEVCLGTDRDGTPKVQIDKTSTGRIPRRRRLRRRER